MEAPTADELLQNKDLMKALDDAWKGSIKGTGASRLYQERGGWIYADPSNVSKLKIREAGKDRSKPVKENSSDSDCRPSDRSGEPGESTWQRRSQQLQGCGQFPHAPTSRGFAAP
ncbi:hypothetical protein O6H91_Y222600 [Diphasiastrum complanatum]|nr:hypothetical protein O6H91_Y222600 [Diphasiastrum complanatum]